MLQSCLHASSTLLSDPRRLLGSHPHDGAVPAPQIGLSGHAFVLPDGRFLRALLCGCREGRALARHHADAARKLGRRASRHGRCTVSRGRCISGAAHQAGRIGRHLRADRRGRGEQGAGRAQGDASRHARHIDGCGVAQRQERVDAARSARRLAQRVRVGLAQRDGRRAASGGVPGRRARNVDRAHRAERADLQRRSHHDVRAAPEGGSHRNAVHAVHPAGVAVRRRPRRAQTQPADGQQQSCCMERRRARQCACRSSSAAWLCRAYARPHAATCATSFGRTRW